MQIIRNIQVDAQAEDLAKTNAVFTIEFESDNKLLVCHASGLRTIKKVISQLIYYAQRGTSILPELAEAFMRSEYITVSVEKHDLLLQDLLELKYQLIRKYNSYIPNGHNSLYTACSEEKNYIFELVDEKEPGHISTKYKVRRGRPVKEVYQYECVPGNILNPVTTWRLKRVWPSIKEAIAANSPRWQPSNICTACANPERTAYGYKWSHGPMDVKYLEYSL